jgi:hypothetical protein
MLRNDYTVPTRCRHRGGIVDPAGYTACRAIRQPISPSTPVQDHSIQNHPKPVSFLLSGVSSRSGLPSLNPTIDHTYICIYINLYTVDTSGVNRLASKICHNRLFRKNLQHNLLRMISTEVSSLATHNTNSAPQAMQAAIKRSKLKAWLSGQSGAKTTSIRSLLTSQSLPRLTDENIFLQPLTSSLKKIRLATHHTEACPLQ